MSIKIITSNTRGLAEKVKRRQVFMYYKKQNVDILFLQENSLM